MHVRNSYIQNPVGLSQKSCKIRIQHIFNVINSNWLTLSYHCSNFQTVTTELYIFYILYIIYSYKTGLRVSNFETAFPICIWNIVFRSVVDKDGLSKNRECVFKNDWRNSISRYHFDAVTIYQNRILSN